jgi:hypothetical protein
MSVAGQPIQSVPKAAPEETPSSGAWQSDNAPTTESFLTLTRRDIEELADRQARDLLGVPDRTAAFKLLASGGLRGTILEAEFQMLQSLLEA